MKTISASRVPRSATSLGGLYAGQNTRMKGCTTHPFIDL